MELLSAFPGALSAIVGVLNFYLSHFGKLGAWEQLQRKLKNFSGDSSRDKVSTANQELLELLEASESIVPQVKAQLMRRFAILISASVGLAGFEAIDFPGHVFSLFEGFELFDFIALIAQLIIALLCGRATFMREEERTFIDNVQLLHINFYSAFVLPAISKMNSKVAESPMLRTEKRRQKREQEALVNEVRVRIVRPPEGGHVQQGTGDAGDA